MTKNTKIILGIIIAVVIIGGIWLGVSREADTPVSKDGEAVKIGVILPLTGDAADYGQSAQKAVDLAVEKINKEYNMEIDIVFEDSQMKPQDAVSSLQKLVSINGIKYVIGFSSGETLAMCFYLPL